MLRPLGLPMQPNFFHWLTLHAFHWSEMLLLVTKSENSRPSWPQCFFPKVELCIAFNISKFTSEYILEAAFLLLTFIQYAKLWKVMVELLHWAYEVYTTCTLFAHFCFLGDQFCQLIPALPSSYADTLWANHAVFLPHKSLLKHRTIHLAPSKQRTQRNFSRDFNGYQCGLSTSIWKLEPSI